MLRVENLRAYVGRLDIEVHIALRQVDVGTLFEVVKSIDAVFRFPCPGLRLTAHPFLFASQSVFEFGLLGCHGFYAFLSPTQVVFVIALVGVCGTVIYFYDFVAHTIQEISVMCDHQQGDARTSQVRFKPFDSIDVEVVCGFVEYQ